LKIVLKLLFVQPYLSFGGVLDDTLPGHLAKRGHCVEVISYFRNNENIPVSLEDGRLHFRSINALSFRVPHLVKEYPFFLNLAEIAKEIEPDIFHINNLAFLTTFQSGQMAKKLKIKNVVHVHGVTGEKGFVLNLAQKTFMYSLGKTIFDNADKVICLTSNDSRKVVEYGCAQAKICVISNGVNVSNFYPEDKEVPNSLIWIGRFVHEKGLAYLIDAMRIVVGIAGFAKVKLTLVGDGPLMSKIQGLVQDYHLTQNVFFRGKVSHADLPGLINTSSLVLLPSLSEGMPYVLLEAMACGKAVIGSDISGINDVIDHQETGFLVPSRNSEILAQAILKLLGDEDFRKEMGRRARNLMVKKYDWALVAGEMEKVYNQLLDS
jgi:glycosyltransferase involved in cell wall biosynthesis